MTSTRTRRLRVQIPHYVSLTVIGILALFPIYFMAITGLKNGVQLQKNPFSVAVSPPSGVSTPRPGTI